MWNKVITVPGLQHYCLQRVSHYAQSPKSSFIFNGLLVQHVTMSASLSIALVFGAG